MNSTTLCEYLEACCEIVRAAGVVIMPHFSANVATQRKPDNSPVTAADTEANTLIVAALTELTPEIAVVAEEDTVMNAGGHARFWLVDPLDGTRSFVRGEAEFTVNIALIENGYPLLGVIYAPVQDALYFGGAGIGAWKITPGGAKEKIGVRYPSPEGITLVRSRSNPSPQAAQYLASLPIKDLQCLSSSIKFCLLAEGSADCYPRFGRTMEWDTAAGQAILEAAGGKVETLDGARFFYGKPGFENPAFVAWGK